jgi:beta-lactam-binding protein with PASTA domain
MSLHQYSIVVHNQYSISRQTYDRGSATVIVLSNRDRQRVTVNVITTHPYKRHSTKVTRCLEVNSASANYKKLRKNYFYNYYY